MILEVYQALLDSYGSALAVATLKAYPTWGKPDMALPCVALELAAVQPGHEGLGRVSATSSVGYRGCAYAANEVELCRLVDALIDWHRTHGAFEVAARRVACKLLEMKRHEPGADALPEQHAMDFLVQAVF